MQNLETLKAKGQESISSLIDLGKQQPDEVKTWGITAAAGIGGALALAAAAKGVLAVISTLATPPVALTVGALGGGVLGWSWMQQQLAGASADAGVELATVDTAVAEAVAEVTSATAPNAVADGADTSSAEGSA